MSRWITLGLRTGIQASRFPAGPDPEAAAPTAVQLHPDSLTSEEALAAAAACPTDALVAEGDASAGALTFDLGQCVMCGRCARVAPAAFTWANVPEVAVTSRGHLRGTVRWNGSSPDWEAQSAMVELRRRAFRMFRRSLHIRHVDAGSCNGCESELQLLSSPYYDLARLGMFFTPTPRHADVLLVTGVVTRNMEQALRDAYEAMPEPKLVVAAGVCALGGGCFAAGPMTHGPLDRLLPVDVYIPGCPPPPLAILHGLLLAMGRAEERLRVGR